MANKDGQIGGAYANPRISIQPISLTSGKSTSAIGSKESNININKANAELADPQSGFNRGLKKRIKGADNIAQQTRLKIKLDKKEQNQEKRAQKKLDRNPGYAQRASNKAEGRVDASLSKLDAAMNPFKPTNGYKANGVKKSMPTGNLMNEGGGVFGLSKSVANGSTAPKSSPNLKVNNKKAVTGSIQQTPPEQSNLLSKGVVNSIRSASIPGLKSSIPRHNTTGSTQDVARRGKPGTSNTSRGGAGKTPGSGKVVGNVGPLTNDLNSSSRQSVFGSGKRNMGFGAGSLKSSADPLSGKQFHKAPKMKDGIHSKSSWGINKPNTEKYL